MLFFIDESGHPHPRDGTIKPTITAVGVEVERLRALGAHIHALKRDILQDEDPFHEQKYKAKALINQRTHRRERDKWEYVEAVFDLAANFPVVSFHIVMERPDRPLQLGAGTIPYHILLLLQRIQSYMVQEQDAGVATVVFDSQDPGSDLRLSTAIEGFLYRHALGKTWRSVLPSPLFVDSRTMPGIQVADYFVSCVRQFHEIDGHRVSREPGYARAIARLHNQVRRTVWDHIDEDGQKWFGEFIMGAWLDDAMVPEAEMPTPPTEAT